MGNCLKTQLKGNVSAVLPKLGELFVKFTGTAADTAAQQMNQVYGSTYSFDYKNHLLKVDNKYSTTQINLYQPGNLYTINLHDLKYSSELLLLNVSNQYVSGSIEDLPTSIKTLVVGEHTESVISLAHLINLTEVRNCKNYKMILTGSIESFVQAQIQKGRTSCSKFVFGYEAAPTLKLSEGLTLNGSPIDYNRAKILSWNWDGASANITLTDVP